MWVRLGDCCAYAFSGKSPKYTKTPNNNIAIGQRNNQNYGMDFTHLKYCTDEFMENYNEEMYLREYDILLNTLGGGTVGRTGLYINPHRFKCITDGHIFVFRTGVITFQKYLYYVLKAYQRKIERDAEGSTNQSFLKLGNVKSYLIPLPPLEEQKRIVAKIEELMPYVDKYDVAYSEVEELNKKFPEDMEKSILQYAIQGKLVEQREEEGTAEALYKQIQEEKKKLIKEGKIKKTKTLPEITEDEIPFDIPENWKWVRLGDLVSFYGGYAYKSSTYVNKSNNMIIRLGNVKNDKLLLDVNPVFVPQEIADATIKYKILPNDILFTMTGTRKKRDYFYTTLINEEDLNRFELFLNQRVGCLRNDCKIINMRWLSLALKSEAILSQIFSFETGTANQGNIGSDNTMGLMIPLPPFDEQERIVAKIGEFLPYTKQLIKKVD